MLTGSSNSNKIGGVQHICVDESSKLILPGSNITMPTEHRNIRYHKNKSEHLLCQLTLSSTRMLVELCWTG